MSVKHVLTHAETMEDVKMFLVILSASARMVMNRIRMVIIAEMWMSVQDETWTYVPNQVEILSGTEGLENIKIQNMRY